MAEHPITPPPQLVQQWYTEAANQLAPYFDYIATQAARWGADAELEACCEWLSVPCPSYGRELRAARRPKPPSLAEQAETALLHLIHAAAPQMDTNEPAHYIRAALERLQELEKLHDDQG